MLTAIIVDDEPRAISVLKKMLETVCPDVDVVTTCTNAKLAKEAIAAFFPDLIFLDINMPRKSGLELLRELPALQSSVIFTTAYNQYVLEALRLSAVDYLLKPVEEELLVNAVRKAAAQLERAHFEQRVDLLLQSLTISPEMQDSKICLPTLKGFQVVKLAAVIFCEAKAGYTEFHFKDQPSILVSRNLLFYEQLLYNKGFERIHKSFLVNIHHIKSYEKGEGGILTVSDGTQIEISRRRKETLLARVKGIFEA